MEMVKDNTADVEVVTQMMVVQFKNAGMNKILVVIILRLLQFVHLIVVMKQVIVPLSGVILMGVVESAKGLYSLIVILHPLYVTV